MSQFEFSVFAEDFVTKNQKQWGHDRSKTLGSSEAFACIRKAWYAKNGTPPDEDYQDSWGAMERGNVMEDHWFVPVMRHGIKTFFPDAKFYGAGAHQTTLISGLLSTTPDGFVVGVPRDCLAHKGIPDIGQDPALPEGFGSLLTEAKTIDPRVNLQEEKTVHHGQTQVQMGIVRDETPFTPNYAVIIYTDASWYDVNTQFEIKFDPHLYEDAKKRAEQVMTCTDPMELLPEGRITGDCRYCPFQDTCYEQAKGRAPKEDNSDGLTEEEREEVHALAREERQLKSAVKDAEGLHKDAIERLKAAMESLQTKRVNFEDGGKVSYSFVSGRKSLSKNKMIEAGLDPSDFEEEGKGYSKITVTEPKG
ncbi:hypothetical protein [Candidatus Macondimonas diazotrophica]|jgi:CRISPR/Cas system-associated exonuclease Cas4 (RecB family)|uniref:PD-(D/E)XK endonuclease-like domain-containing protein n=1 Tax=Candidatus Macondimonas diazotrophica TaxID=2305248 RepID=A0A4Z0F7Y3_9GAMM|nr:hypothetical protein [Candidatus Macondimonas diazotrophica]TFZ81641.1 hypothetical protein E4680_11705 [Candidatus Macondimonas diazotrophica]